MEMGTVVLCLTHGLLGVSKDRDSKSEQQRENRPDFDPERRGIFQEQQLLEQLELPWI